VRGKGGRPHIVKISYDAAQTVDRSSSRVLVIGRMVSWQPGLPLPDQPSRVTSGQAESGASGAPGHSGARSRSITPPDRLGQGIRAAIHAQLLPAGPGFRPKLHSNSAPPGRPTCQTCLRNWLCGSADLAQTRAVSLLNRQTAPAAKIASHAMTLTTQVQSTPPPSSGACTSWLSPYSGDHLAMS
jgi:hypothetical protein